MNTFIEFLNQQIEQKNIAKPLDYFNEEIKRQFNRRTDAINSIIVECLGILDNNPPPLITKRHIIYFAFAFHFNAGTTSRLLECARAGYLYARNTYDLALLYALDHGLLLEEFEELQKKCYEAAGFDDSFYPFTINDSDDSRKFTMRSLEEFILSCEEMEEKEQENFKDNISTITERLQADLQGMKTEEDLLYAIKRNHGLFRNQHERAIRILTEHFQEFLYASLPIAAECNKCKDPSLFSSSPLWPIGCMDSNTMAEAFKEMVGALPIEMVEVNRQFDAWLGGYPYIIWNRKDWHIRSSDTGLRGILTGQFHLSRTTFLSFIAFFVSRVRKMKCQRKDGSFKEIYPLYEENTWFQPKNTGIVQINEELKDCGFGELSPDLYPDDRIFSDFFKNEKDLFLKLDDSKMYIPLPLVDFMEDRILGKESRIRLRESVKKSL